MRGAITGLHAAGLMAVLASMEHRGEIILIDDRDDYDRLMRPAPTPRLVTEPPRQRTTEHKHSREIERRLRQEARRAAKLAADVSRAVGKDGGQ